MSEEGGGWTGDGQRYTSAPGYTPWAFLVFKVMFVAVFLSINLKGDAKKSG